MFDDHYLSWADGDEGQSNPDDILDDSILYCLAECKPEHEEVRTTFFKIYE